MACYLTRTPTRNKKSCASESLFPTRQLVLRRRTRNWSFTLYYPDLSYIEKDENEIGLGLGKTVTAYLFYMECLKMPQDESRLDRTLCCMITSRTVHPTSDLQGWKMDSPATRESTTFLLAKPPEHFGGAPPIPSRSADESPKPGQIHVHSSKELHTQPWSSMSAQLHRLHKQNSFAEHNLGLEVGEHS